MTPLVFALPKGRLLDPTLTLLASIGMETPLDRARELVFDSADGEVRFLLVKPVDVPTYVEQGAADLGVVGTDVLMEADRDVLRPLDLGFGRCRLVVAAPERSADYRSERRVRRIATKYPRIAERFFAEQRLAVDTIVLGGSVELAPNVGLADWIVDLVETGRTLRDNGLVPIAEIAATQAQLIANRASHKMRRTEIETLIERLRKEISC